MTRTMTQTLVALTLAAATVAGAAAAQATYQGGPYNSFSVGDRITGSTMLDVGTVRAQSAGVVELYDLNGTLLGSAPVFGGANTDVRIRVVHPPQSDIQAELKVGGQIVAQRLYTYVQ